METWLNAAPSLSSRWQYHGFMASTLKVGEPARVGRWGLTVDSLVSPCDWVVVRYPDEGKRHSEPHEILRRLPYVNDPRVVLVEIGMSEGTATTLLFNAEVKRLSPKAAESDRGFRPVR
jgi:hypothetical protein